jgi:hypothetical protein
MIFLATALVRANPSATRIPPAGRKGYLDLVLYFCEPGASSIAVHADGSYERVGVTGPGQRVFDVLLGKQRLLKDLDIFQTAGGVNHVIAEKLTGVALERSQDHLDLSWQTPDVPDVDLAIPPTFLYSELEPKEANGR